VLPLHEAVEKDLDANFQKIVVPHPNRTIATWYLLTVLEDVLRNLFILTDSSHAPFVEFQMDSQKYAVRFALDRIRQECKDGSRVGIPSRVVPKIYIKTADLLNAGVKFKAANQLCSAAHAGTVRFTEGPHSINISFDDIQHDKRYAALELLGHMSLGVIDHSANLYIWAREEKFRPPVVEAIAHTTRVSGKNVFYEYDPNLAFLLSQELMQQPFLVPEGWRFPWGGRQETTLLINAMCVRCTYHWIAVHFGANHHGLRGGGESSLLHVSTTLKLASDVHQMCSLDERIIHSFIQYLTYGYAMRTPDPALQPIISLGNGLVAVPCLMFLSSNHERNLLGLQARINGAAFNSMSKLFEKNMVGDLLTAIRPRWPFSGGNVTIRTEGGFEEIDLLIGDSNSKTILVCELRWMLQPGDPREVQHRKKACWEKVAQLSRKVQWLRARQSAALNTLGIVAIDPNAWTIEGVVVIKTFGGVLSTDKRLPVMTERVFLQGMQQVQSLRHFADWSQSLGWLPQENVHFRIVPQDMHLNTLGKRLSAFGMEKLSSLRGYTEFVDQSLQQPTLAER
jgi:hypothetical protein